MELRFWAKEIVGECKVCQQVNAYAAKSKQGKRPRGEQPGVYWEVGFTEVKPGKYGYKYFLVFVDTFSGWVKVYPTKQETGTMVAKKILEENFPIFDIPKVISSDNIPSFVAQIRQLLIDPRFQDR